MVFNDHRLTCFMELPSYAFIISSIPAPPGPWPHVGLALHDEVNEDGLSVTRAAAPARARSPPAA